MKEIAIAVVRSRQGRFLVGERPDGKPLAGYAEFPGGKVEPNESAGQAAVRECLEETGLAIDIQEPLDSLRFEYAHGELLLHFFLCSPQSDAAPMAPYRWVEKRDLGMLNFPEANVGVVAHLLSDG